MPVIRLEFARPVRPACGSENRPGAGFYQKYPPFLDEPVRTYLEHASSCRFVPKTGEADAPAQGKTPPHAHAETARAARLHRPAPEADRLLPQLRGNEGRAAAQVEIRHPPADLGAWRSVASSAAATTAPARWRCCACRRTPATRTAEPAAEAAASSFSPNVIRGDFSPRIAGVRAANEVAAIELPLYGRIAAGLPIEALRDASSQIEVPMAMLANGEHYALEVAGDSMIEAGILDGDTVIIRKGETSRERPDRGGAGGRCRGDAEAAAPARQLDRAGAVQRAARDADLPGRQGEGAGSPCRAAAAVLNRRG